MLRAFLYKTSSKLKKFKINFEDKASLKRASEDENNETEEIETSDDEYLPDFTKLQPCICEKSQKVRERKLPRKRNIKFRRRQ